MSVRIQVPAAQREKVEAFARKHKLDVEFVDSGPCDLTISESPERRECEEGRLEVGGWIRCAVAWHMAGAVGIPLRTFGDLLNDLDVKIRECSLGCFP